MLVATVDLVDAYQDRITSCETQFKQFGGRQAFSGAIRTIRTCEDNSLVRRVLESAGDGAVLVVDGAGSLRMALVGDLIAGLALKNGWSGLVLYGAVRDVERLGELAIGIKALGSNPMRSAKESRGEIGVPVTFGGVTFRPGEMLYSDRDGIIVSATPLS